jgi:hypothetical protein
MKRLTYLLAGLLVAASSSAHAQSEGAQSGRAAAALTVEGSAITISAIRPLTFAVPAPSANTTAALAGEPAILEISGDPGRAYRIRLPDTVATGDENDIVDHLTIQSQTSGDVSKTLTGRMNADGHDRLYIGGLLRRVTEIITAPITTTVPVSLDYE